MKDYLLKDVNVPAFLAVAVTAGFFSSLWLVAVFGIPATAHDLMVVMVGVLGSAFMTIVSYFFGSSSGSADKTKLLSDATNKP